MYREEPLNRKLDRLQGDNDTLQARIQELEENGARVVNVWNVNWGNINWPILVVISAILSGLMMQAQTTVTVVEVERVETVFRTNPGRTVAPTMVLPTDWVSPHEELVCDGRDNDCPDYGPDLSPRLVCDETSEAGMVNCHFEQPSADPSLWEDDYLRFGNW